MNDMVYVSLIGDSVIVNKTQDNHIENVAYAIHNTVREKVSDVSMNGEMRYSVKIRSVYVSIGK